MEGIASVCGFLWVILFVILQHATCNVQHDLFLKRRGLLGGYRGVAGGLRWWRGVMVLDFVLLFMGAPFFESRMGGVGDVVRYRTIRCVALGLGDRGKQWGVG